MTICSKLSSTTLFDIDELACSLYLLLLMWILLRKGQCLGNNYKALTDFECIYLCAWESGIANQTTWFDSNLPLYTSHLPRCYSRSLYPRFFFYFIWIICVYMAEKLPNCICIDSLCTSANPAHILLRPVKLMNEPSLKQSAYSVIDRLRLLQKWTFIARTRL